METNIIQQKEELQKQINELEAKIKPLKEKLYALYDKEHEDCDAKIERTHALKDKFTLDELVFAAYTRCPCGAGMAYPKNIGPRGHWDCSDILLGRAVASNEPGGKTHEAQLPFAFYNIKGEGQPSANGATTRPDK